MEEQIHSFPKSFEKNDIEEVELSSKEDKNDMRHFGVVETWKRPEVSERAKARPYIASVVMFLWVIGTTVGLIRFIAVGDISVLIYSPVVLMVPVKVILDFYFKRE